MPKGVYVRVPKIPLLRLLSGLRRDHASGCWEWQLSTNGGYGQCSLSGRQRLVHRVMWEIVHGSKPGALCVCHHCDNRLCCNPAHLFLGTRADNNADMMKKGRYARGERNGQSKLKANEVLAIRQRLRDGVGCGRVARDFGTTVANVYAIRARKSWSFMEKFPQHDFREIDA